jgi:hypothetical protein
MMRASAGPTRGSGPRMSWSRRFRGIAVSVCLALGVASAQTQDSTLVVYDYDQIGNLTAVRRTDMKWDVSHCGGPRNACPGDPNGSPLCIAGTCSLSCYTGYSLAANNICGSVTSPGVTLRFVPYDGHVIPVPTVPAGSFYCGGAFVLPENDPENCGACGRTCAGAAHGTRACRIGVCTVDCESGYLLAANGVCGSASSPGVSLKFVPYDGHLIPAPTIPAGSYYCNGAFVLPQSDPANCGTCGNACPAGTTCGSGTCS